MKGLFISLSFLAVLGLTAQSKSDSLLRILPTLNNDSLKIEAYIQLEEEFYRTDLHRALGYISQAEELARKSAMSRKGAEIRWRKSYVLTELKRYKEARAEIEAALVVFTQKEDAAWVVDLHTQMGSISNLEGKNEEASGHYLEALKIAKNIGDKNREASIYNYLGGLYKGQRQFIKALENYERAVAQNTTPAATNPKPSKFFFYCSFVFRPVQGKLTDFYYMDDFELCAILIS
jgi:tetratricopeptide (TPR) repeat protein